jgi:hypothetical protein
VIGCGGIYAEIGFRVKPGWAERIRAKTRDIGMKAG